MGGYEHLALVGTTAVVALVGSRMIYVANCGDSRAVLCRSGGALPLTDDHKAAREDETVRGRWGRDGGGYQGAGRRARRAGHKGHSSAAGCEAGVVFWGHGRAWSGIQHSQAWC